MKNFDVEKMKLDEIDKRLIKLVQNGIELIERPYQKIADELHITENEVVKRLSLMKEVGFIRKNAIATNHYKLGYLYNAMTVWEIDESLIDEVGQSFSQLNFISHSYRRPKIKPDWNYNLFAMVHGKTIDEVNLKIDLMKEKINGKFLKQDKILSLEILKKTGIRLDDGPKEK